MNNLFTSNGGQSVYYFVIDFIVGFTVSYRRMLSNIIIIIVRSDILRLGDRRRGWLQTQVLHDGEQRTAVGTDMSGRFDRDVRRDRSASDGQHERPFPANPRRVPLSGTRRFLSHQSRARPQEVLV